MKKERLFLFLAFLVLSSSIVSAYNSYTFDLREGSEQVIELVVDFSEPFLQVLLGGEDYTGLLLFERFLIFILLLSIVYLSLSNISAFEDMKAVTWVVSVIIPLIAIRFIDYEWLNTILISYQVLGIAIAGILPFIIYLFFLHNITESSTARKIGWIFFIVVYFGLWSTNQNANYAQIYFWTMLIAVVFLLMDGTIHRAFQTQKWKAAEKGAVYDRIASIDKEFTKISESNLPQKIKDQRLRELKKERKKLRKLYT